MRLRFAGVFADAGVLWRADSDLLVRVASVFFFLPALAARLFIPPLYLTGLELDPAVAALGAWFAQSWYLVVPVVLAQIFGQGVLFALLLAPDRPRLDAALGRALRLLPTLTAATIGVFLMILAGVFALIRPGFYLTGRTLLTGAVVMAESEANPVHAISKGIRRTRNNGWVLMLVALAIGFVTLLATNTLGNPGQAAQAGGVRPLAGVVFDLIVAAITATAGLAQLLLQAAAYRALTERQGI
jgi:hypothetical protein